ncbi:cell division protein ZapA [Palleronia sp. LCG004]|uniref:cell division protein ZapA n=1 Tax=Palleronia sp. LCG004 TaxID=3079304 RepID=UPI0029435A41|nr:cell division protein ZapA [Palleronia sp. LCG004]WOI57171.1 cell division protein ZapA [Palleronia sp. LCG004]
MPEITVKIGGRAYEVACQSGEEPFLEGAAAMLDAEAETLAGQAGRLPESRMLLMAGLMLADKTAGVDERLRAQEAELADLRAKIAALESAEPPEPERVEVPVIPNVVLNSMAEFAARAEALAQMTEDKARESEAVNQR